MLDTTSDLNYEKLNDNRIAVHRGVNMIGTAG